MTNERKSTCHAVWIIAHENTERIFFLSDLSLQFGNLRVRGVEHLFGLQDVQLRGDTVLEAVLCQLDGIFLRWLASESWTWFGRYFLFHR